jgi:hypothetical protein
LAIELSRKRRLNSWLRSQMPLRVRGARKGPALLLSAALMNGRMIS